MSGFCKLLVKMQVFLSSFLNCWMQSFLSSTHYGTIYILHPLNSITVFFFKKQKIKNNEAEYEGWEMRMIYLFEAWFSFLVKNIIDEQEDFPSYYDKLCPVWTSIIHAHEKKEFRIGGSNEASGSVILSLECLGFKCLWMGQRNTNLLSSTFPKIFLQVYSCFLHFILAVYSVLLEFWKSFTDRLK